MEFYSNLKEISKNYTHLIFDVWGVIHDGTKAYDGVIDVIKDLHNAGKKICFLSNAPRRAVKVEEVLAKYGVTRNLYDFILTSGEATHFDLEQNQKNNFENFGKNYFYIGPKKDIDLLDDLQYNRVDQASQADVAIATGFDHEHSKPEEKLPQIREALQNNLPLICVNPDLIVVKQNGHEMICAGIIAQEYERNHGKVYYYGKPYLEVYNIAYKLLGQPDKAKILAIGDGLETDIKGAYDFGIASALVTGGILCNKLGVCYGEQANSKKVKEICEDYQIYPDYVIPNI